MHRALVVMALVAGALAPAASALAGGAAADAAPGSIGIRLLDAPADRQDDPRARMYVIDHIDLGDVIVRRIEVSNSTDSVQQVAVYGAAAAIANGSFAGLADHTENELSSWTSLDQDVIDLQPASASVVTVTVDVPDDAAPGEQYAVIWAEVRSAAPAGGGITAVNRVGIRMYVDVGPGGESASSFTISALTASRLENGQPQVEATVTNTGGRALDLGGTLALAEGPGGLSAGPFDALLGTTLAPGDVGHVTVPLDEQLPNGPWLAQIELASGLLSVTAEATITFPDSGAAEPVPATTDDGFPQWAAVSIAVGLLLALGALIWFLRRRRAADDVRVQAPLVPDRSPVGVNP